MNASISLRTQAGFFTAGGVTGFTGCHDQCDALRLRRSNDSPGAAAAETTSPTAPPAIGAEGFALEGYRAALADKRLDAAGPLGTEQLVEVIERAEGHLAVGRRDEAIALLAAVVEGGRFVREIVSG